jgi:hypothetical protein
MNFRFVPYEKPTPTTRNAIINFIRLYQDPHSLYIVQVSPVRIQTLVQTIKGRILHRQCNRTAKEDIIIKVAVPHHVNADPVRLFTYTRIRILFLIKVMRICDH